MNMKIIIITSIFMFISLVVARSDADCLSNQVNSNIAFIAVALTLLLIIAFAYFFSSYRKWISKNNSISKNLIGYIGGASVGMFLAIVIVVFLAGIDSLLFPSLHKTFSIC